MAPWLKSWFIMVQPLLSGFQLGSDKKHGSFSDYITFNSFHAIHTVIQIDSWCLFSDIVSSCSFCWWIVWNWLFGIFRSGYEMITPYISHAFFFLKTTQHKTTQAHMVDVWSLHFPAPGLLRRPTTTFAQDAKLMMLGDMVTPEPACCCRALQIMLQSKLQESVLLGQAKKDEVTFGTEDGHTVFFQWIQYLLHPGI